MLSLKTLIFAPLILIFIYLLVCAVSTKAGFVFLAVILIIYLLIPIAIFCCQCFLKQIIFMNKFKRPSKVDYGIPTSLITCTFNDYVYYYDDTVPVTLGMWHILPEFYSAEAKCEFKPRKIPKNESVILYFHGNSGTRATEHRVGLYKVLRSMNFHVIAFDYRGFSDSSQISLSEDALVRDSMEVYKWVSERSEGSKIYIWGHSLGSGIACKFVGLLSQQRDAKLPVALFLESPFNNMTDEVLNHFFAHAYTAYPFFKSMMKFSLKRADLLFASDEHIRKITIPILIMHAEDDEVVPYMLGLRLYKSARASRKLDDPNVVFQRFPPNKGFLHKNIFTSPELPDILKEFISDVVEPYWKEKEGPKTVGSLHKSKSKIDLKDSKTSKGSLGSRHSLKKIYPSSKDSLKEKASASKGSLREMGNESKGSLKEMTTSNEGNGSGLKRNKSSGKVSLKKTGSRSESSWPRTSPGGGSTDSQNVDNKLDQAGSGSRGNSRNENLHEEGAL